MKRLSMVLLALMLASCGGMRMHDTSGDGGRSSPRSEGYYSSGARVFPGMDPTFEPYYGE